MFIIPPYFNIKSYIFRDIKESTPILELPYGVLSIAAYVNKYSNCHVEFNIVDLNTHIYINATKESDIEELISLILEEKINRFNPDYVGISALFNSCYSYLDLIASAVKNSRKESILFCGGGLATNHYEDILNNFISIDAVCYGEGEIPVLNLINSSKIDECLDNDPSWITLKGLRENKIPINTFVENLDDIPYFDYSLVNYDDYTGRTLVKLGVEDRSNQMNIHTSRGCPYNCCFCASSSVHGKKVRYMSSDKVKRDIKRMINEFNINKLSIEDDHFFGDKDRAKEILKCLSDLDLRVEFPNAVAVASIDDEIAYLLKNAGVSTMVIAVESGSDYVLKEIINKPLRVNMIKGAVDSLKKYDICVHSNFIIGFPGELEEHRLETMKLIYEVGFDWCYIFIVMPVLGSRLFDLCKENNYLVDDDFTKFNTQKCNIRTDDIIPEEIEKKAYLMNLEANFINNYNMRTGNYDKAALYFENIVNKYPDHAFGHYALAQAYKKKLEDKELINYHIIQFEALINKNEEWLEYAKYFMINNK